MAEIVSGIPPRRGGGRKPKYPWDEWLDGNLRKLTSGEEFTCKAYHLAEYARDVATLRGLKVQANVRHEEKARRPAPDQPEEMVSVEVLYLRSYIEEEQEHKLQEDAELP